MRLRRSAFVRDEHLFDARWLVSKHYCQMCFTALAMCQDRAIRLSKERVLSNAVSQLDIEYLYPHDHIWHRLHIRLSELAL